MLDYTTCHSSSVTRIVSSLTPPNCRLHVISALDIRLYQCFEYFPFRDFEEIPFAAYMILLSCAFTYAIGKYEDTGILTLDL